MQRFDLKLIFSLFKSMLSCGDDQF